jgi:hypothetical protein
LRMVEGELFIVIWLFIPFSSFLRRKTGVPAERSYSER